MAAVLVAPHPTPTRPTRPSLALVTSSGPARRPSSRSVTPPPRLRPSAATFWRRRLVALLVLSSLALGAHLLVSSVLDRSDDLSVVTVPAAATVAPVGADPAPTEAVRQVYVVHPGDTMWSIASDLQPEGDVRALVDQLTERAGGSGLQAGQRIALDGLGL